jgi:hypothetical protein
MCATEHASYCKRIQVNAGKPSSRCPAVSAVEFLADQWIKVTVREQRKEPGDTGLDQV